MNQIKSVSDQMKLFSKFDKLINWIIIKVNLNQLKFIIKSDNIKVFYKVKYKVFLNTILKLIFYLFLKDQWFFEEGFKLTLKLYDLRNKNIE